MFYQPVESVRVLAGQTATYSFWARASSGTPKIALEIEQGFGSGGSPSATVDTYVAQVTLSTSWQRYSVTMSVPSISGKTIGTGSSLKIVLDLPQNTTWSLDTWGWQVEAGSVATPFTTATGTIQGELAACQRYYYRNTGGLIYSQYGQGPAYNSTTGQAQIVLPVCMRVTPTSIDYANLCEADTVNAVVAITSIVFNSNQSTNQVVAIVLNVASGLTQFRTYNVQNNNNTAGYLGFSAEL